MSETSILIDSRKRDKNIYPNPSYFIYDIENHVSNVSEIELSGINVKQSNFNVNSSNNVIPFNINDSITSVKIVDSGYGYQNGTFSSTGQYVTISNPGLSSSFQGVLHLIVSSGVVIEAEIKSQGGNLPDGLNTFNVSDGTSTSDAVIDIITMDGKIVNAYVTNGGTNFTSTYDYTTQFTLKDSGTVAEVDVTVTNNQITNVSITNPGSGYLAGNYHFENKYFGGCSIIISIPFVTEHTRKAELKCTVGNVLYAKLFHGIYNLDNSTDKDPGLCREVTRALQEAVENGSNVDGSDAFPYATANSKGSCEYINVNTNSENKQIIIRRGEGIKSAGNDGFLELLWGTYEGTDSAINLLGYGINNPGSLDATSGTSSDVVFIPNVFSPPSNAYFPMNVVAKNDPNLDPPNEYFILQTNFSNVKSNSPNLNTFILGFENNGDNKLLSEKSFKIEPIQHIRKIKISLLKHDNTTYDLYGNDFIIILKFKKNVYL